MSISTQKTIACLPIAGSENPYQQLMMEGLREGGFRVQHGVGEKWLAFTRTWLKHKPDALHLDWPGSYYLRRNAVLAALQYLGFRIDLILFSLLRGKLVWTCHNLKEHEVPHPGMDEGAKRALGRIAKRIRVFSEGQREAAAAYLNISLAKLVVVPEGSYVGYYPDTMSKAKARKALGLPEEGRVMVNFGNLRPYKGIDRLITAFNALQPDGWNLLIAGPAHNKAYVAELKRMAGGNRSIHILPGFVKKEEVQQYMRAADLAVFPFNRIDNSGSVILAMGFDLAVVAPNTGAVMGRLREQPTLLFDEAGLESRLKFAMALGEAELARMGKRNKKILQEYRWLDFARIFSEVLQPQRDSER